MQLKLITVRLDPESGDFPPDPLAGVEGEVINVVEHFFHHAGLPHLLLIVHLRPASDGARQRAEPRGSQRPAGSGPRATLDAAEQGLYDRLVAWRNAAAQQGGVPPYVIATNREIAEVARQRPTSLAALHKVPGFGDAKVRKYGEAMLAVLALPAPAAPPPTTPTEAPHGA